MCSGDVKRGFPQLKVGHGGCAMSWSKAVSEARYWAASNSLGFVVASEDEKSRRIIFKGSSASFYVTVPDSENLEKCVRAYDT